MKKARRGIYAAAISPVGAQGRLDAERLVAYCAGLFERGCDGVAPMGTTGEGTSFALAERLALPEAFAKAGFAADRVIFGAGAAALGDAQALVRAALEAGFCNVLVLPPFYYKGPHDQGLYDFYARLIEGVGSDALRLYLYHFPQMSAVPLSPGLVARLREAFGPVVAGLKDSSGDFAQSAAFIEATGGVAAGFDVYPSSEAMLFDGLEAGAAGVISGSTNAFSALAQAAMGAPGVQRAAAMERVAAARAAAARVPLIAAMKRYEAWRSGDDRWLAMVPPNGALSEDEARLFRAELETLGLMP